MLWKMQSFFLITKAFIPKKLIPSSSCLYSGIPLQSKWCGWVCPVFSYLLSRCNKVVLISTVAVCVYNNYCICINIYCIWSSSKHSEHKASCPCNVQSIRLWDRHTGKCKSQFKLTGTPSAVFLLSDHIVVAISQNRCSVWKDTVCLQQLMSHDQTSFKAAAIADHLIFLASESEYLC